MTRPTFSLALRRRFGRRHSSPFPVLLALVLLPAALAAAGCDSTAAKVDVTIPATGLAVVSSDYTTTTVSLIDPVTRAVVHDDCIDSNTVPPTLSLTLSGDVSLPSSPQHGGDVLLIDDANSALTWVNPQSCAIRHQLSVSDFDAFPHDVISIADDKAYVTRFGTNPTPTDGDPASHGDDILIINPGSTPEPTVVGRIDLAPYAAPVDGASIEARPDRGLLVGTKVYVTLASQDAGYTATGEGRVVIIDTATDTVSGMIALTGLAGCSALDYLASSKTLFVACGGSSSGAGQAATSGIALVNLGVEPPVLKGTIPASALGGTPLNFSWVAAVSEQQILSGTFGVLDFVTLVQSAPDAVWSIAANGTGAAKLIEGGAFNLGRAAVLTSPTTLLVPDANASQPLLHVFGIAGAVTTPGTDIDANPAQHLPPRTIAWY
jgi:hypothetical protein